MDNNPNPTNDPSEEEYHFATEPETSGVFAPPSSSSQPKGELMGRIKRKNILIALGVIIVVFSLYKILDAIIVRHSQEAISPTPITPTVLPSQVTALPPQPAPQPEQQPQESANIAAMTNRLSVLEEQSSNYQAGINKLNEEAADLKTSVSNINSQIAAINQGIQNIADKLAEQEARAAAMKVVKIHRHRKKIVIVRPVYFVRAIIPGRAWLSTAGGGTLTVRLGDTIPGYGVVLAIDPVQGTITTSVGAIIGYSPGES
jgi:intracellular multiplication protein IcmG